MERAAALFVIADKVEDLIQPDRETDFWVGIRIQGSRHTDAELQADIDAIGIDEMIIDGAYTSSLDAVSSIVPDGWHVGMLTECDEDDHPAACLTESSEPFRDVVGRGSDMILSFLAAALRAQATVSADDWSEQ